MTTAAMRPAGSRAPAPSRPDATQPGGARQRWRLVLVLVGVAVLAGGLRAVNLTAGLPDIVHPDEATVVTRGLALLDGERPQQFDWPPGSSYLYAGAVLAARMVDPAAATDPTSAHTIGRVLFLLVGVAAVVLTGLLAAQLAPSRRLLAAAGAGTSMAVAYSSVRLSQLSHPDHLQLVGMLVCVLLALRFERDRRTTTLVLAGVAAGLAGAAKYVGIGAGMVPLIVLLAVDRPFAWSTVRRALLLAAAALVGFVAGTGGAVLDRELFLGGLAWQFDHQAGGHLGYEGDGPGWLFHAAVSLPGNWGWPVTLLAGAGVLVALVRGDLRQRAVAVLALAVFLVMGASQVQFPHYVLPALPFLAALAWVAVAALPFRRVAAGLAVVALASLGVAGIDALRYVRATDATSTRTLADAAVSALPPGPVWAEAYALATPRDRDVFAFGDTPEVLDCGCFAVLSSYQEERFRRLPDRYAEQIAVYDAARAQGTEITRIDPSVPLTYRWDLLPRWGAGDLPLTGDPSPTGPIITIIDLR